MQHYVQFKSSFNDRINQKKRALCALKTFEPDDKKKNVCRFIEFYRIVTFFCVKSVALRNFMENLFLRLQSIRVFFLKEILKSI